MAQFQTPQFIEREAKIIGPLSFKQAAYIGLPLAVNFVLWFLIAADYFIFFVLIAFLLEGAGIALAFGKVEGRTFPQLLMNVLFFLSKPKTYVWERGNTKLHFKKEEYVSPHANGEGPQKAELVRKSRVADLAVKVQTKK
ncbi:MAG: hypothetical protein A2940_00170 [Candidatus Wildermuthbacteria bacterium RIFCSPLOWO2_01_FULL_48_29]|uniref:PrgI family protein n=2 Tax=Candidatus Wildermuthiibacteriota TaxID=1817923 RepID=A0A1G2RM78_9BACT|nr:MAG: hypothetical protein A2843_01620 [Candidatus Wildermuthbacteria bacterium RIFCSPHIGHO2_01_FULL_48_27b]OHA73927.1 MAG: hypothetical protein A2940_00170 [Candidatus Wildermuthbacteria bacterium RIFCSPLOWO2_01_FULL_48_29]